MQIGANLLMTSGTFKAVDLGITKVAGIVSIVGSTFDGPLDGYSMRVGTEFSATSSPGRSTRFTTVSLASAAIAGRLRIDAAVFEGADNVPALNLESTVIGGNLELSGVSLNGRLNAVSMQVGAHLQLSAAGAQRANFKDVTLVSAKVAGNLVISGSVFQGQLNAIALQVGAHLLMASLGESKAEFTDVNLGSARVAGNFKPMGVVFNGRVDAVSMQVGAHVALPNTTCAEPVDMALARIGGDLDISESTLSELRISGATIAGEFVLGGESRSVVWRRRDGSAGALKLHNTRVGNLVDARDAWPSRGNLGLEGFAFMRLGGFDGRTPAEMRSRGMRWWDEWARRDTEYSLTAYEQLAAALVLAGQRGAADEIRLLGRERQRETEEYWGPWLLSTFLQYVAGFGIGTYTFRVLYWVALITAAGALYLWTSVELARAHGPVWCLGASFTRLLPAIEVNKEFADFFNDPERQRLTAWQSFVFSTIRIVGWVLGIILLAAVTGLTQKG